MGELVDPVAEARRRAAPLPVESAARSMQRDLVAKQDAWLQQMADDMGLTIEQLAERYHLEYDTVDVWLDGTDLRATNTARLVRRDKHAEVVREKP